MPNNQYPFYTEPIHDGGTGGNITAAAGNAARDTLVASAEGRLIVDIVDRIALLEPAKTPFVSLLTNVGKVYDGAAWAGLSVMKAPTNNPEFSWLNL